MDKRPENSKCSSSNPVVNFKVFFCVPYEPKEFEISPPASFEIASVKIFKLAPKAPEPLVEVPTPRCNCKLSTDDAKSPRFTQNVP